MKVKTDVKKKKMSLFLVGYGLLSQLKRSDVLIARQVAGQPELWVL